MKYWPALGLVLTVMAMRGPATAQMKMPMGAPGKQDKPQIPTVIADMSKAKTLPSPIEPGIRGYGTRAVEGRTLSEMKAQCVDGVALDAIHKARCDQLHRTLQAAPVNTR